jgi:hypothetical protein
VEPVYSGSLYARLVAETPFFIGGSQPPHPGAAASVEPFRQGEDLAVPATSLAGMLGSLAEAASNSALRILDGTKQMSFRKNMQEGLSAIGMIRVDANGSCHLLPLAMPHLKAQDGNSAFRLDLAVPDGGNRYRELPTGGIYLKMFPRPRPKVYWGDTQEEISSPAFLTEQQKRISDEDGFGTFPLAADPSSLEWDVNPDKPEIMGFCNWPEWSRRKQVAGSHFMLGMKVNPSGKKCTGIFRCLGVTGDRDLPNNKKHEIFIPCTPDEIHDFLADKTTGFPVHASAVERFHVLADERTEDEKDAKDLARVPYEPIGTRGKDRGAGNKLRLQSGDLVYFLPNQSGDCVMELSFSSIWRGRVETLLANGDLDVHTVASFFEKVNPNLLPLGASSAKTLLTIAELLFGFVEQSTHKTSRAMAGRVRFHAALPHPDDKETERAPRQGDEVTLKALSSPKLPSAPFYFENKTTPRSFSEAKLLKPKTHQPKGRKVYLHHHDTHPNSVGQPDWKSLDHQRDNLKLKIRPLCKDSTFYFRLDFDNLSRTELGLLCYALRPCDAFRHKLGLGRPLGLGTIRIDPVALRFIDRNRRYICMNPRTAPRFHSGWTEPSLKDIPQGWLPDFADHKPDPACDFESLRSNFIARSENLNNVRMAIEALGDPAKIKHPVHYPQREGREGADLEDESFKWFVANTKPTRATERQAGWKPGTKPLGSVDAAGTLPTLPRKPGEDLPKLPPR